MKIKLIVLSQNLGVRPNMVYLAPNCRWVINFLEDSPIEPLKHREPLKPLIFLNLLSDLSGFQRSQWFISPERPITLRHAK